MELLENFFRDKPEQGGGRFFLSIKGRLLVEKSLLFDKANKKLVLSTTDRQRVKNEEREFLEKRGRLS